MNAISWLTLALVLITAYYAYQTREMTITTKNMFEEERRPYLSFEKLEVDLSGNEKASADIKVGIGLRNVGKVLLAYSINTELLKVVIDDKTVGNPTFINNGGHVFPGQYTVFQYNIIRNIDLSEKSKHGTIEFTIEYKSILNTKTYKSYRKLDLWLTSERIEWKSIKELEE